jgi:phosphoribosylamine--glycine ligase
LQGLCKEFDIPTGTYETFRDAEAAKRHIRSVGAPIVVKADGLAAGKGVVVARSIDEALTAVDDMLLSRKFGDAGAAALPCPALSCETDGSAVVLAL